MSNKGLEGIVAARTTISHVSVYYTLGIPLELFTNVFACARMAGWTAHVIEQNADNRLIRPASEYVGPKARSVRPIVERA